MNFFSKEIKQYFLLIIFLIFNIHRTHRNSTKIISLIMIFLFTLLNIYIDNKKQFTNYFFDKILLLLYSIVCSLHFILKSFIKMSKKYYYYERTFNDEIYVYDSEFKRFGFTKFEYKNLISPKINICHYKKKDKLNLINQNEKIEKIYLFVTIPNRSNIKLKYNNTIIYDCDEGTLIGGIESVLNINKFLTGIEISNSDKNDIIYVEINKNIYEKFINKHLDTKVGTKFLFMMSNYNSQIFFKLNEYILNAKNY